MHQNQSIIQLQSINYLYIKTKSILLSLISLFTHFNLTFYQEKTGIISRVIIDILRNKLTF